MDYLPQWNVIAADLRTAQNVSADNCEAVKKAKTQPNDTEYSISCPLNNIVT